MSANEIGFQWAGMWLTEKICLDTDRYFELVLRAIANARQTISLEMYIFREEGVGVQVLTALREAAARGVRVRVLVDGLGSPRWNREFQQQLLEDQIITRIYHPVPDLFGRWKWQLSSLATLRSLLASINKRNHRKLIIIDQSIAFIGSCNVAEMHRQWRETAVRVTGRGVAELGRSFDLIWSRSVNPHLPKPRRVRARTLPQPEANSLVRTNYTRRLRLRHNSELAARIERAIHRVWITNAYFVPSPSILAALVRASRNGCEVILLLPSKSDISVVPWVSRIFYRGLMRVGVQIYEYQPTMLHAKTMMVDDWLCVGTTNLNHRSLYHDLEVDVVLTSESSRQQLAAQFREDLQHSQQITAEKLSRRSLLEKIGGYACYPFRRFI